MSAPVTIRPISSKADKKSFVDLAWDIYRDDPYWVPPLKGEVHALLDPGQNPWFGHARLLLFLAERGSEVVGRISAHVDDLMLDSMPDTGLWGLFEAKDAETATALIAAAEDWLRGQGMKHAIGPVSLSIWDEPGLLIQGFEEKPMVMMGHHKPEYEAWVEQAGYSKAKDLFTFALDIRIDMIPVIERLIQAGEKNPKIVVRNVDKSKFDEEAAIILEILNDAWSDNWGFIPLTPEEIAYGGKKLKPIIVEDLCKIIEYEGRPVAFMLTIPDINEMIADLDGKLFPFGWAKLLWRLRRPSTRRVRVPLMGVRKDFQSSRLASTFAFLLIEYTRRVCVDKYGINFGEFGWVLEDNQGMMSIANLPGSGVNHTYRIYQKSL